MGRARVRALSLWQVYLAGGRAALRAVRVGAAVRRQRAGLQPARAVAAWSRSSSASAATGPRPAGPWRWFALGFLLFWLGDLYTYSYPRLTGTEVPFPSLGDAAYVIVYPALMVGPADPRPAAQPGARPRRGDRLADHDARPRADLVDRADPAVAARRRALDGGQAGLDRLPDRRHPAARGGDPARRRLGHAPAGVLPARLEHRRPARDRLRLRPRHPRRRLRRPGVARRGLDQLLPAVGRGGAAPVDGASSSGPRRSATRASRRCGW